MVASAEPKLTEKRRTRRALEKLKLTEKRRDEDGFGKTEAY